MFRTGMPSLMGGRGGFAGGRMGAQSAQQTNLTNSNDPNAKKSRVFIGNLNTTKITKQQVEETFSQYGQVQGVSVHKGYAFVQYNSEFHARHAVGSEDGKVYAGQRIDVNLASEPKSKQLTRKRTAPATGGWPSGGPDAKTAKTIPPLMVGGQRSGGNRNLVTLSQNTTNLNPRARATPRVPTTPTSTTTTSGSALNLDNMNSYVSSDILVCGNCKEQFPNILKLVDHKKSKCQVRIACECRPANAPRAYVCASCGIEHATCWSLVQHCQTKHDMYIYTEPEPVKEEPEEEEEEKTEEEKEGDDGNGMQEDEEQQEAGEGEEELREGEGEGDEYGEEPEDILQEEQEQEGEEQEEEDAALLDEEAQ